MNKKYFCIIFMCIFIISNAFASTTTYERTLDNLQISSDITVTSSNRNNILNTPKVNETEKVYDFANLFTNSQEEILYSEITDFIFKSDLDMAIVTIDNNPKYSAMVYADDFYDYNYFGIGDNHDGLLFLIDMDTREMYISTTGEAIRVYDDNRIDKILDSTYSEISNQDYYGCAYEFIEKSEYYFNIGIPESNKYSHIDENGDYIYEGEVEYDTPYGTIFVISLVIALIVVFVMKSKHKTIKKATTAWAYMHKPSITHREDIFLTTNTVKTYFPRSSGSGGGGSSIHRSSSGRSHGGGGRRF